MQVNRGNVEKWGSAWVKGTEFINSFLTKDGGAPIEVKGFLKASTEDFPLLKNFFYNQEVT